MPLIESHRPSAGATIFKRELYEFCLTELVQYDLKASEFATIINEFAQQFIDKNDFEME